MRDFGAVIRGCSGPACYLRLGGFWSPSDVDEFAAATGSRWTGADIITWSALADVGDPETATVYLEWTRG